MHCLYGGYNLHRFSDALGLVIGATGLGCEDTLQEIMCPQSFYGSDLTFDPSFKGRWGSLIL